MTKIFAISTGPETHLDHLAPICALFDVPLIVTEEAHLELGHRFYPMCDIRYIPIGELSLEYIAKNMDVVIECGKFWAMELKPALKLLHNKDLKVVFAPHGHSDKEAFLDAPIEQDVRLVYGPNRGKGIEMGNLRLEFYLEYKAHFDELAAPFFDGDKESVLYAPTWESKASPTSVFERIDEVVDRFASSHQLLVKLHPLLEETHPAHYHRILGKHDKRACFIEKFPPIYPLLERSDIYLGDFSSIGYDFLYFDRPMYFLKSGGPLEQCGKPFQGELTGAQKTLSPQRKKLYRETFGDKKTPRELLGALRKALL